MMKLVVSEIGQSSGGHGGDRRYVVCFGDAVQAWAGARLNPKFIN